MDPVLGTSTLDLLEVDFDTASEILKASIEGTEISDFERLDGRDTFATTTADMFTPKPISCPARVGTELLPTQSGWAAMDTRQPRSMV